jgi:hypothetical protein
MMGARDKMKTRTRTCRRLPSLIKESHAVQYLVNDILNIRIKNARAHVVAHSEKDEAK